MKGKEYYIYLILFPVFIAVLIITGIIMGVNGIFIVIMSVIMCLMYLTGIFALLYIYKKINKVRGYIDSNTSSDDNLNDYIEEKYLEGEIGKLAMTASDLKKRLFEEQQKQLKEKEFLRDIISDISHQIKTPVAALTVFNDILSNEIDEKYKPMIEQSGLQIERIKWLVLSMLQLARIEASSIEFNIDKVSFNDIIKSCIDILAVKANEKNVEFNIKSDNESIKVDSEWFKEAIINVLKNAIEYSPDNSKIDISVKKIPIETRIYITDYGIGIPESERLNIFKRFYTVHSNQVNPNSVGIGLSLSRSIIEGMGGRIWVESRYKDECKGDEQSYTKMIISIET
ncbi:MAG: HAMP domain-containing histidine kinase [Lachnospiraceae bacterium]|nr:HAMP domain-containing histidine kinase [Lachnospiraceae bacterium]